MYGHILEHCAFLCRRFLVSENKELPKIYGVPLPVFGVFSPFSLVKKRHSPPAQPGFPINFGVSVVNLYIYLIHFCLKHDAVNRVKALGIRLIIVTTQSAGINKRGRHITTLLGKKAQDL